MTNEQISLLKGLIQIRTGKTIEEFSKGLNISRTSLSLKMNGKVDFKLKEVQQITEKLALTDEEFIKLFKAEYIDDISFENRAF